MVILFSKSKVESHALTCEIKMVSGSLGDTILMCRGGLREREERRGSLGRNREISSLACSLTRGVCRLR